MTARAQDVSALFVAEKRRMNASWSAISRMTGVPEVALRRHHDETFGMGGGTGFVDAVRKDPRSDREKVRDALTGRGLTFDQAVILSRMWLANGARRKSADLAQGTAGGAAAAPAVNDALWVGKRLGLSKATAGSSSAGVGYALTAASVVALSKLAGLGQARPSRQTDHPMVRP